MSTWYFAHSSDLCISLCAGSSVLAVLLTWESYRYSLVSTCSQPIHVWLLVACLLLFLFRAAHRLTNGKAPDEWDGSGCSSLFIEGRNVHAVLIAAILYPLFICWVLVGSSWYSAVHTETGCLVNSMQRWLFSMWLVVCFLWILAYTSAIVISAMIYCVQSDFYSDLSEHLPDFNAFSQSAMERYPGYLLSTNGLDICSICLEELQAGEQVRTLRCSHTFHLSCIDPWLYHHRDCPLCKQAEPESASPLWQLLSL
jgi:hypothetical protein